MTQFQFVKNIEVYLGSNQLFQKNHEMTNRLIVSGFKAFYNRSSNING